MKPPEVLIAIRVPIVRDIDLVVAKPVAGNFPPDLLMALRILIAALVRVWSVAVPYLFFVWVAGEWADC